MTLTRHHGVLCIAVEGVGDLPLAMAALLMLADETCSYCRSYEGHEAFCIIDAVLRDAGFVPETERARVAHLLRTILGPVTGTELEEAVKGARER